MFLGWKTVVGFALAAVTAPAIASEEGAKGNEALARTASLFIAIQEECPEFYAIDKTFTRKAIAGIQEMGLKEYGEAFRTAFNTELERRVKEVEITGAQHWCTYQRGYQSTIFKSGSMFKN